MRFATIVLLHDRPENTSHLPNAGLMLVHRPRRWPNNKLAIDRRIVFAGIWSGAGEPCRLAHVRKRSPS